MKTFMVEMSDYQSPFLLCELLRYLKDNHEELSVCLYIFQTI